MTIDRMIELCNEMKSKGCNYVNSTYNHYTFSKSDRQYKEIKEKTLYIRVEREKDLSYKNIPCKLMSVDVELNRHGEVDFKCFIKINVEDFPNGFDMLDHFDYVYDDIVSVNSEYLHSSDYDNSLAFRY